MARPSANTRRAGHAQLRWALGKSTCFVVMCEMDYFSSLNAIGQQRYIDKLRLLDLSLADNPYTVANSINFVKGYVSLATC